MIFPAVEAMRLPGAKLSADEQAIVDKLVAALKVQIPEKVRAHGFEFETNCNNPAPMFVVIAMLEEDGWSVNVQPLHEPPRFQGAPPSHVGYKLFCAPSKETRDALKKLIAL